MRKAMKVTSLLMLILVLAVSPAALAQTADYAGDWVCVAVDMGDGVKLTQYEGSDVGELMKIKLNQDGSLMVTTLGMSIPGTWKGDAKGVSANIEGEELAFELIGGQLVNTSNGVTAYMEKAAAQPKTGGLLSLVKGSKYLGKWVPTAVDEGDGILKDSLEGVKVADLMALQVNRDGTIVMTTMGVDINGKWHEIEGGINADIEGEPVDMMYVDAQLVANTSGVTIYFKRLEQGSQPEAAAIKTPAPALGFAGKWEAVRYETMGLTLDIKTLFPDGCFITLRDDGTAEAFVTKDFTEKLTWSQTGDTLALNGSYVFSSPEWSAEKQELKMKYANSVSVVFIRGSEIKPEVTAAPLAQLTPEPTPEPTAEPTPEPTAIPATAQPAVISTGDEPLVCETSLFALTFSGEGWTANDGWRVDREDYSAVRYELKDASGSVAASMSLTASSEGVRTYRDKIKALLEYAAAAGKENLEMVNIGGIAFSGVAYEKWGWKYAEFAARVPESRVTLFITVEQPDVIGDNLQTILGSITYKLPVLTPANLDPPLPEDGAPYQPATSAVKIGEKDITAKWLKPDKSIILDSTFNNQIAFSGNRLYVLAGKTLYAYTVKGDKLTADRSFADGKMLLEDEFEYLATGKDGILFASNGIFNILSIKDGAVLEDNNVSGYLVLHPSGEWGITFWVNADPMLVRVTGAELKEEPWIMSNLSDASKRQGRFSSISCVSITDKRIYVAGTDAEKGDAQRVGVYDLDGKELFTFGAEDWSADDAFGSVTGVVETKSGILVQDGNYRAFKLFSHQGEFLGSVDSDKLLGTNYPWLSSMIPADGGVLTAAAQSREDESGDELLIFKLSGL